jgi:hypothetical protein
MAQVESSYIAFTKPWVPSPVLFGRKEGREGGKEREMEGEREEGRKEGWKEGKKEERKDRSLLTHSWSSSREGML